MCHQCLSNEAMNPSQLPDHMRRKQLKKVGKRIKYFEEVETAFENQSTIKSLFKKQRKINNSELIASNEIAKYIAKIGNAHMVAGKIVLSAVEAVISEVTNPDPSTIITFE